MGVISRGIKNAFRNTIRTISIIFILALSIAMSLIMLLALKTVQAKIDSVKSSIGNTITISPAGVRGFEGGGEQLTMQNAADVQALPHVTKVTESVMDHLTPSDTSLVSSVEAGSFGNRQQQRDQGESGSGTNPNRVSTGSFSMPIMISGLNDFEAASSLGTSSYSITSGSKIDGNSIENVAIVGTDLAAKNNLLVGQTFTAYGSDVTVAGIFDSGSKFTNSTAYMPIRALQKLSGQSDQINSIVVQTDSIDSVASVQSAIQDKLGSDKVDVTSQQDTSDEAVKPLENIKTISLYSLIGSLVAGSIIIFLTMIMIVRERRREIGVLKAIGSSNIGIVSQFIAESLSLTFLSGVVGIILGIFFSNPVLKVLVSNSESTGSGAGPGGFARGGGGMGAMMARMGDGAASARNVLQNIHAVVSWEIILYGLAAAVIIAILGSAIPAFFIAKVRPAEVMRAE